MKWLGVGHEVVSAELVLLEGVGKKHLFQAKPKVEPLVQHAYPKENPNDVHMNINGVDSSVVKELVNQQRERKPQPLTNVDFWSEDAIHLPPNRILANCELGAQRSKGNADLQREGVLPPKCIWARLSDKLDPGNDAIGIRTRENFHRRE